jgi:hypothetical protein
VALNKRGLGKRINVTAAAARTSGQAVVEQGWAGFAETTTPDPNTEFSQYTAQDMQYVLDTEGEWEVPFISGAVIGDSVYIGTSTFAMAVVAAQAAAPTIAANAVVLLFAKVTAVPGGLPNGQPEPATGLMWIALQPQAA